MLLDTRTTYKPMNYPWAYDYFMKQGKMHWMKDEVQLAGDIKDWREILTPAEKNFLTQIFRFFTQGDIDVAAGYYDKYIPYFTQPELRMMMGAFANMEGTHIDAYAHLLETVGIPEAEYNAFLEYDEMKAKHDYLLNIYPTRGMQSLNLETGMARMGVEPASLAKTIAAYSAFGEGLQLFSSFLMLLNFQNTGKMKGMCQIVAWSIRDEAMHVEAMTKVYRTLVKEYNLNVDAEVYEIGKTMVALEDKFIDLAFEMDGIEGLDKETVKKYVRYIADLRFQQLGLEKVYHDANPYPWIDYLLKGQEHTNFFENRATSYTKNNVQGSFTDVFSEHFGV